MQQVSNLSALAVHAHAPRKTLYASLIEALHHSRREQARRVIGQFHHLIANIDVSPAFELQPKVRKGTPQ
jgi:hypothetical protein